MLQTLLQLCCSSLDTLWIHLNVLAVRGPELNTGFEIASPVPSTGSIIVLVLLATQFLIQARATGLLGQLGTLRTQLLVLLNLIQLALVHQSSLSRSFYRVLLPCCLSPSLKSCYPKYFSLDILVLTLGLSIVHLRDQFIYYHEI